MIDLNRLTFGIVEDIYDPTNSSKFRVRVIGLHTDDKNLVPTESLPWCSVLGGTSNPFISGKGLSPARLLPGTCVAMIPLDDDLQEFLIIGSLGGHRQIYQNSAMGFNGEYPLANLTSDVNVLAGGIAASYQASAMYKTKADNAVVDVPIASDPTVVTPPLDPEKYKDTPWMPEAYKLVGINEKDNPGTVKEFLTVAKLSHANVTTTPWCACFVAYVLEKVGIKSTRSGMARSYLNYGTETEAKFGAIAVFSSTRSVGAGHVGFVVKDNGDSLSVLGGNQSTSSTKGKLDNGGEVTIVNIKKNGTSLKLLKCVFPV